ncbi:MAG: hypothetical protein JXB49_13580 [Bacteroidales bacterium]|nr:hypothetical protein [Bacteroidales bacterium]
MRTLINKSGKASILLAVILSFSSCMKDEINLKSIKGDFEINPRLALPLVYGKLTIMDIIPEDDTNIVLYGPNRDSIKIVYMQDSIAIFEMTDLFEIPPQAEFSRRFDPIDLNVQDLDYSQSISLGQMVSNMDPPASTTLTAADGTNAPFPAVPSQNLGSYTIGPIPQFGWVELSEGTLSLTVTNNLPVTISALSISLTNSSDNSLVGTFNFTNIAPNSSQTRSVDLAGKTLTNTIDAEITDFSSPGSGGSNVPIDLDDDIRLRIRTSNLRATSGNAILPSQTFAIDTSVILMETESDERVTVIELSAGRLDYNMGSAFGDNMQFSLTLPNTTIDGIVVNELVNISAGGSGTGYIDLSNSITTFEDTNRIPIIFEISTVSSGTPINFDLNDTVSYNSTLNFTDINIRYIEGYLGQHTRAIELDTFNLDELAEVVKVMNKIDGVFTLTNPILYLFYKNTMGIPLTMDILMTGVFDGREQELDVAPQSPQVPDNRYSPPTEGMTTIDKYNSPGLTDFLTFPPPDYYLYEGTAISNPDGYTGHMDFLYDDSKVVLGIEVQLPLELKAERLTITDTINFSLSSEDTVDTDMIEYLILHYAFRNAFPFDLDLEAILYDSITGIHYDTIVFNSIMAAPTDNNGVVLEDYVSRVQGSTSYTGEEMGDIINNVNKLIIKGRLNTWANNGVYDPVKILTWYYIDFAFGVDTKVRINNTD